MAAQRTVTATRGAMQATGVAAGASSPGDLSGLEVFALWLASLVETAQSQRGCCHHPTAGWPVRTYRVPQLPVSSQKGDKGEFSVLAA